MGQAGDSLRRSKDEEIVVILCSAILSNYTSGMSVKTLNMLYDTERRTYKNNEKLLTQSRFDDIISLFSKIVSDLEKVIRHFHNCCLVMNIITIRI